MLLSRHSKIVGSLIRLTAIASALLMLTVLVVTRSEAAFSDTTSNASNSFSTGSVVLTDDDLGATMFTAATLTPGVPQIECITVTYSGTLVPADIRLYAVTAGALNVYLDTSIDVGTGGVFGDCSGFVPVAKLYTGTMQNLGTSHVDWASGIATYTATTNPQSVTVRFTVDVQDDINAQGQSSTADFIFEARD